MDTFFGIILLALAIIGFAVIVRVIRRILSSRAKQSEVPAEGRRPELEEARTFALEIGYDEVSTERLGRNNRFRHHVDRLSRPDVPFDDLARLARSDTPAAAALGLSAIARRSSVPENWPAEALRALSSCSEAVEPFVYETLERYPAPMIGPALSKLDEGINWQTLAAFVEQRRKRGERVNVDTFRRNLPVRFVTMLEAFLDRYEDYLGEDFRGAFEEWRRTAVDVEFLTGIGRVLERPYDQPPAYVVGRRGELVEVILDALEQKPRRSLLLAGEHGVGKSRLVRAALDRLPSDVVVFEATAAEINAGAMWIGELEGRIKELAEKLQGHSVVWLLPGFEEVLYAGQHSRSPMGMLDALLPHIERGELTIVGELDPSALERLLAERPRVAGVFEIVRVRPLDEESTIAAAEHKLALEGVRASHMTLTEAYELAQQFLPRLAAPGNLLRLVDATVAAVEEAGGGSEFAASDVLAALASSSGLPLAMLDPNAPLDLEEVRAFFDSRVLAQPEAVDCIVERISMIKAGLNDPTRPLGVFLFIGPTGTGKTEIAKAVAEFLFGSARRLVRLDMSEYQTPDALERLLQDPSVESRGSVLLSSVRKDPFAVILLDEFEKAAAPIWDLFLQVFDDGRLTDHQGRTADFRRCIIILTSNVGSALAHRPGLGFKAEHGRFRSELIEDELKRTFRPEFLNRIDRTVVFRPFARAEMRALLEKELAEALARRGLRTRPWAVELDESAIEFLIEEGFSPELGARPLKRALERHLLARIARPIVEQAVPEGDQFLLVSAGDGQLEVTFVDPDAPEEVARDADLESAATLDLRALALSGRTDKKAARFLLDELGRIRSAVEGDLRQRKDAALEAMQDPGFWQEEGRYAVLAEAEYLDRLEAAFQTAVKLGQRLERARNGAGELPELLSLRLYVLQAAIAGLADRQASDVFLRLRPAAADDEVAGAQWVDDLAGMYAAWARRRGMRFERLDDAEHLYAVSGLGAGTILLPENGLHLLEVEEKRPETSRTERLHALVQVVARSPGVDADRALDGAPVPANVVRRYRAKPTPLVRDAVRGYRTGRLDRVLAGDFDLF